MKTEINLLPPEIISKRLKRENRILVLPVIIAIIIYLVASFFISSLIQKSKMKIQSYQQEINNFSKEFSKIEDQVKKIEEIKDRITSKKEYFELVNSLVEKKSSISDIFREISLLIPDNLWLNRMEFDRLNSKLTMGGKAFSNNLVQKFLVDMQDTPYFLTVRLMSSGVVEIEGKSLVNFQIESNVGGYQADEGIEDENVNEGEEETSD